MRWKFPKPYHCLAGLNRANERANEKLNIRKKPSVLLVYAPIVYAKAIVLSFVLFVSSCYPCSPRGQPYCIATNSYLIQDFIRIRLVCLKFSIGSVLLFTSNIISSHSSQCSLPPYTKTSLVILSTDLKTRNEFAWGQFPWTLYKRCLCCAVASSTYTNAQLRDINWMLQFTSVYL